MQSGQCSNKYIILSIDINMDLDIDMGDKGRVKVRRENVSLWLIEFSCWI